MSHSPGPMYVCVQMGLCLKKKGNIEISVLYVYIVSQKWPKKRCKNQTVLAIYGAS